MSFLSAVWQGPELLLFLPLAFLRSRGERCHFWRGLQLNSLEHNGCPGLAWAPGGEFPTLHGSLAPLLFAAEVEEFLQGRATSEGRTQIYRIGGSPWAVYFFAEGSAYLQFVDQVLFIGTLFDEYFFPLSYFGVCVVSCPWVLVHIQSVTFPRRRGSTPRTPSCARQRWCWCFGIRINFAKWHVVSAWVRLDVFEPPMQNSPAVAVG